ncbi:helix-turn-helix domain-containing protein [Streptomyces sp. NPDC058632]|uniref:helix-turn-helix domain-containing protein n=1 Tax=unclassified Streptomyces TaxID=2593676 RepID=UPI00365068A0
MRPRTGRHTSGERVRDELLEPENFTEVAAFMAGLRRLRAVSGLTFRELAHRAEAEGRVLPASTLATALSREKLPRAELVEALVRACGCPPDVVAAWLAARSRLAHPVGPEATSSSALAAAPEQGDSADAATAVRRGRPGLPRQAGTYIAVAVVAAAATLGLVLYEQTRSTAATTNQGTANEGLAAVPDDATAPAARSGSVPEGKYRIRAVYSGLCLAERVGEGSGQVHQARCADAIPDYALEQLADGTYQILSNHPEFGPGCMGVTDRRTADLAQVADDVCGRRGPAERFALEPADTATVSRPATAGPGTSPDQGSYRLRPRHSQKCLGFTLSARSGELEWQPLLQVSCDPAAEEQLFAFDPVK